SRPCDPSGCKSFECLQKHNARFIQFTFSPIAIGYLRARFCDFFRITLRFVVIDALSNQVLRDFLRTLYPVPAPDPTRENASAKEHIGGHRWRKSFRIWTMSDTAPQRTHYLQCALMIGLVLQFEGNFTSV